MNNVVAANWVFALYFCANIKVNVAVGIATIVTKTCFKIKSIGSGNNNKPNIKGSIINLKAFIIYAFFDVTAARIDVVDRIAPSINIDKGVVISPNELSESESISGIGILNIKNIKPSATAIFTGFVYIIFAKSLRFMLCFLSVIYIYIPALKEYMLKAILAMLP
ncbi:MAG: hypothetical protein BEN18_00300 [Epulopiscium sp. Nuni2H_MBin001]|nr:MAG: hypothetical protein BEN18_00300 [Epulopiscium sp. Nuni2H_MBin001]